MQRPNRKLAIEQLEQKVMLAADVCTEHDPLETAPDTDAAVEFRTIDGTENNAENPEWGSTDEQLLRLTTVEYADGISDPAGTDRPSAREVSNAVADQIESTTNDRYLTDLVWLWGQFVDHDIDLTENATDENGDPTEPWPIDVPTGDLYFDPDGSGDDTIGFNRSAYDESTGDSLDDPRQQINQITAYLDGSVVYGSDQERSDALRTFDGGKLKTSEGDLLPFNEEGLANAGGTSDALFLAGDVRANENAALTAMHTLWVREHNRIADEIAAEDATLSDEEIYQQARAMVTAQIQAITYNEFLPALLGFDAISAYDGYDSTVNSGIANIFSTSAYRFGHSMLSSELLRLNNDGSVIADGNLSLSEAFFAPDELIDNGIDSILLGTASQLAQEIDNQIVDDVRNFLFGPPGSGGFDLASLNIQRGRDHGLPDYNQARIDYGLDPVESFADITSDSVLAAKLEALYGDVNNIDVWVGALAEDHVPGSSMGELNQTILVDQFQRIRDGDALWYQNIFSGHELREIENTTLADVIERNTDVDGLQGNVFFDASVIYHEVDARGPTSETSVVARGDQVQIVDGRSRRVIESRPADEVSAVIIVGADHRADQVRVDTRQNADWNGEVIVHGGAGRGDTVTVVGTRAVDDIEITAAEISVNGQSIEYSGIETIYVQAHRGQDDIQIADDVEARVVVLDRAGPRQQHDRQGESSRNQQLVQNDGATENDGVQTGPSPGNSQRRTRFTAQPFDADMLLNHGDLLAHIDSIISPRRRG